MRFATACAVVADGVPDRLAARFGRKWAACPLPARGTVRSSQATDAFRPPPIRQARSSRLRLAAAPAIAPPAPAAAFAPIPMPLALARVVEIDTSGGPGFGFEHFKAHDFLRPGEVVLTFDDGPWPRNTAAVLAALASALHQGDFFPIGKHASWHPEILRQVAAAGHSVGIHTWSHSDLSKKPFEEAKRRDREGHQRRALRARRAGGAVLPFPGAAPSRPISWPISAERNIAMFSTDLDSFDFKCAGPNRSLRR